MKKLDDYQKYLPILSKAKLFEGIPLEHYPQIFNFLQASILSFEKDELIHTEVSRKYDDEVLKQILSKTDIRWEHKITDSKQLFANYILEKN